MKGCAYLLRTVNHCLSKDLFPPFNVRVDSYIAEQIFVEEGNLEKFKTLFVSD